MAYDFSSLDLDVFNTSQKTIPLSQQNSQ